MQDFRSSAAIILTLCNLDILVFISSEFQQLVNISVLRNGVKYKYSYLYVSRQWIHWYPRAGSRFAPSQWETLLQSNTVSHRLGTNLEWALYPPIPYSLLKARLMRMAHEMKAGSSTALVRVCSRHSAMSSMLEATWWLDLAGWTSSTNSNRRSSTLSSCICFRI